MAKIEMNFKLRMAFNMLPTAEKIENQDIQLRQEYNDFISYGTSQDYLEFQNLDKIVKTKEFEQRLQKIKNEKFEGTKEALKEKEFLQLKKSTSFRKYFSFKDSDDFKRYKIILNSSDQKQFDELEKEINSSNFKNNLGSKDEDIKLKAIQKKKQYQLLKSSSDIRFFAKMKNSSNLSNFQKIDNSKELEHYLNLEKYLSSKEFIDFKTDMLDKERYKRSEEFKKFSRHQELSSRPAFIQFQKDLATKKFHEISLWKEVFADNFSQSKLDSNKWIESYFWGKKTERNYSLASDYHFFTKGRNFDLSKKSLIIRTKKESIKGTAWDTIKGFYEKDFQFTSGIISSGESFRMNIGKIEAKIKLTGSGDVFHAFWAVTDKMLPQLTLFKQHAGKIYLGTNLETRINDVYSFNSKSLEDKYFIFNLLWEPKKLTWYINGIKCLEMVNQLPNKSFYFNINSGIDSKSDNPEGNGEFEIAWLRFSTSSI